MDINTELDKLKDNLPENINKIKEKIEYAEKNKIPYNTYYKSIVTDYMKNIIDDLVNTSKTYNFRFIKYKNQNIKLKLDSTNYNFMDKYRDLIFFQKEKQHTVMKYDESKRVVYKFINQTRDELPKYLQEKFKLKMKPSNGFLKMFEILTYMNLVPVSSSVFTVHLAESPGNFIAGFRYKYMSINPKGTHYWLANSLNPKTVKHALPDMYGYIKKNPNNWMFGKDNTGNILNTDNILDYKKKIQELKTKNNIKINLLTSDLGINTDDDLKNDKEQEYLEYTQKLDLAQAIACMILSDEGSNCVIKHFLPFMGTIKLSSKSSNYFVGLIYLYYIHYEEITIIKPFSSNKTSSEFYIVGKKFKKVDSIGEKDLVDMLNKYKVNHCIFDTKDIPQHFLVMLDKFMDEFVAEYITTMENIIFMQQCYLDTDDSYIVQKTKCKILFK